MVEMSAARRMSAVLFLFLLGCFVVALGFELQRGDPAGNHAAVRGLGWIIVLCSVVPIKRKGWRLIVYLPMVWLLASGFSLAFIGPAASISRSLTMPSECRGAGDYWEQIEIASKDMNTRHELVMTDSIESQRECNTILNAAEQDHERMKLLQPPLAAQEFHTQYLVVHQGWMDLYKFVWDGTFERSMLLDLQDEDDLLESYQLEFARKCSRYVGNQELPVAAEIERWSPRGLSRPIV